ncbi:MAG: precorrin-6y C5,15-methyltransferase (decarboxylating) subunit CbiE [Geminicoccaceae bacterium]|nr:precorrin-6y C5,15-methyltransferase (decarboxylating) subunit CbiE [Geminicoccaceae bacterium]
MNTPWLDIIGIGESGVDSLSPAARTLLENAEVILGGDRHHDLSPDIRAERLSWPSPFDAMIETIRGFRGRRAVILVTGDPLWFSVGARIVRALGPEAITFHPQLSAFQYAACRMGWSLADLDTLTLHGRPVEHIIPCLQPGARIIALTRDHTTPGLVAGLLTERGFGRSRMTALAHLGGSDERRFDGPACDFAHDVPDFHVLAIECRLDEGRRWFPRHGGLPDEAFAHDGRMTKRELRAIALAKLAPRRGALLWDIGCGCGSVAIEWMRGAPDARAIGLEPRADRRALAARNALALGTPRLDLRDSHAPDGLEDLPAPDSVFIGGGLGPATIDHALRVLKPHGRLVAHAVTLESEAILLDFHSRSGGELMRLSVARAEPVGSMHGWRPLMPVTQWSLERS